MSTVQNAATAYAEAEKHLRLAQTELNKIPETYKALSQDGTIGYLEYLANTAEIKALSGKIAAVEGVVAKKHSKDTKRAQALGIDAGPASGGDDIGIMSGGGR